MRKYWVGFTSGQGRINDQLSDFERKIFIDCTGISLAPGIRQACTLSGIYSSIRYLADVSLFSTFRRAGMNAANGVRTLSKDLALPSFMFPRQCHSLDSMATPRMPQCFNVCSEATPLNELCT